LLVNILRQRDVTVTSSNINAEDYDKSLVSNANIAVCFKDEIPADNVELRIVELRQIPLKEPIEVLADIASSYNKLIAVAASHGKTTTTGLIGSILMPNNPTINLNATTVAGNDASRIGSIEYFVTEASEQKREFLRWKPHIGVILNSNLDHTYYYIDENDYKNAFMDFAKKCNFVVVANDCKHLVADDIPIVTVGIDGDYSTSQIEVDKTINTYGNV